MINQRLLNYAQNKFKEGEKISIYFCKNIFPLWFLNFLPYLWARFLHEHHPFCKIYFVGKNNIHWWPDEYLSTQLSWGDVWVLGALLLGFFKRLVVDFVIGNLGGHGSIITYDAPWTYTFQNNPLDGIFLESWDLKIDGKMLF